MHHDIPHMRTGHGLHESKKTPRLALLRVFFYTCNFQLITRALADDKEDKEWCIQICPSKLWRSLFYGMQYAFYQKDFLATRLETAMKKQITETMHKIEKLGLKEEEYQHIFKRLSDTELALLEQINALHRLAESELRRLLAIVDKIYHQLQATLSPPSKNSPSWPADRLIPAQSDSIFYSNNQERMMAR